MASRTYVALMRAINVGGRFVSMERLRALYEELGLKNVRSYIQSGNVFFESAATNRDALAAKIEARVSAELGFDSPVFLRTVPELEAALERNAFEGVKVTPQTRLAVLFAAGTSKRKIALPHHSEDGEYTVVAATKCELYVVLHQRKGRPGNPVAYVAKQFGIDTTARFHHTALKILAAAKSRG